MSIYTSLLIVFLIIFGVGLIYPLFFAHNSLIKQEKVKQRAIYKAEISALIRACMLLVSLIFVISIFGTSNIKYTKELYSYLIVIVTILIIMV